MNPTGNKSSKSTVSPLVNSLSPAAAEIIPPEGAPIQGANPATPSNVQSPVLPPMSSSIPSTVLRPGVVNNTQIYDSQSGTLSTSLGENLWDRMDRETDRAWGAFRYFRDLGTGRSLKAVYVDFALEPKTIQTWCTKFRWRERTEAWDRHLDKIAQKAFENETASMARRHADIGMKLQNLGKERLSEFSEKPELKATVSLKEALDVTKAGVEMERTARAADKGGNSANQGTIIFNFNMAAAPKWAPKSVKGEGKIQQIDHSEVIGKLVGEVVDGGKPESADKSDDEPRRSDLGG